MNHTTAATYYSINGSEHSEQELHRSSIRLWLTRFSTKGNGESFRASTLKQNSETLLGLICALINGDSRIGSSHKKSAETRIGTIACLYMKEIQVVTSFVQEHVKLELHVHQLLHHVGANTCANCTSLAPLFL